MKQVCSLWVLSFTLLMFSFVCYGQRPAHILPIPQSTLQQQDLAKYLPSDQLIEVTIDDQPIKIAHAPYMSAQKKGIVVILPDIGQPPLASNGSGYLQQALTDDGFDTYVLPAPNVNYTTDTVPEISDDTTDSSKQKIISFQSEYIIDGYKDQMVAGFQALYQTLTLTRGEQFVVVAIGTSAGLFGEYLASTPSLRVDAFISISAQLPHPQRNKALAATLSLVSAPLLDIYYSEDNPKILRSIKQRQRWVKRNNKYDYRQRQLYGVLNEHRQHQRLRKELNGFLRQL